VSRCVLIAGYQRGYLCILVEHFELEFKGKFTEVSGGPEVEMIREDNIVISECELHLCFIDGEDISQLRPL
jgi:hypothetical protein